MMHCVLHVLVGVDVPEPVVVVLVVVAVLVGAGAAATDAVTSCTHSPSRACWHTVVELRPVSKFAACAQVPGTPMGHR
jgi:hypothetical protein